jgi:hypothetical protein
MSQGSRGPKTDPRRQNGDTNDQCIADGYRERPLANVDLVFELRHLESEGVVRAEPNPGIDCLNVVDRIT